MKFGTVQSNFSKHTIKQFPNPYDIEYKNDGD